MCLVVEASLTRAERAIESLLVFVFRAPICLKHVKLSRKAASRRLISVQLPSVEEHLLHVGRDSIVDLEPPAADDVNTGLNRLFALVFDGAFSCPTRPCMVPRMPSPPKLTIR